MDSNFRWNDNCQLLETSSYTIITGFSFAP
jgi:hypothetical protein